MKYILTLSCLIVLTFVKAQTIEKFYDYAWKPSSRDQARFYSITTKTDSGFVREDYFIRERSLQMTGKYNDADCTIQNGQFAWYYPNHKLDGTGNYINGRKEGLWRHYYDNGKLKDSTIYHSNNIVGLSLSWHPNGILSDSTVFDESGKGSQTTWFENGNISSRGSYLEWKKETGEWKYYHNNGSISSIEIFENGKLINKTYLSETGEVQSSKKNSDRDPEFRTGNAAWQRYIMNKAYFPDNLKIINTDKVVVVVDFYVNEEGNVVDAFVSTPLDPQLDKLAFDIISQSPKWEPAISHNRKVKVWLKQAIFFSAKPAE